MSGSDSAEGRLRAANARLRQVVEAKDALLVEVEERYRAELEAERSACRLLEQRVAELERRLGMDSSNSSTPGSKESISAKAKRKAARQSSQRVRSKDRKPGGQPGRTGSGLEPAGEDDRVERRAEPPSRCRGCDADLHDGADAGSVWAQVWDIPPVRLEKVHWWLPRRRCGCGTLTTAAAPSFAQPGTVCYGPNVNAAAILLSSEGNVPVERTAMLMSALLSAPVSTGFVSRAHERLADRLGLAGFDEAMRAALRAEEVLCADESPVNVARKDTDSAGEPVPGSEHVVTVRTPDERLVWLAATASRSKEAIKNLGVLDGYHGFLVRDDYAGWHQFDDQLAGVQQCGAHYGEFLVMPIWNRSALVGGGARRDVVGIIRGFRGRRGVGRWVGIARACWSAGWFWPALVL